MKHISEYFPEALAPAISQLIQKEAEQEKQQMEPVDEAKAEVERMEGEGV